jgi:hypothetical protein
MKRSIKSILATLFILACSAFTDISAARAKTYAPARGNTYVCDVQESVNYLSGEIKPVTKGGFEDFTKQQVIFDENSSVIKVGRDSDWVEWKLKVYQRGTNQHGLVAVRTPDFKPYHVYRTNPVVQVLRVATFVKGAPFVFIDQGVFHVGTCKVFKN